MNKLAIVSSLITIKLALTSPCGVREVVVNQTMVVLLCPLELFMPRLFMSWQHSPLDNPNMTSFMLNFFNLIHPASFLLRLLFLHLLRSSFKDFSVVRRERIDEYELAADYRPILVMMTLTESLVVIIEILFVAISHLLIILIKSSGKTEPTPQEESKEENFHKIKCRYFTPLLTF